MIITLYGHSCFKISSGETVLAFDPPAKESRIKSPYFQTDIVCISHEHEDHNGRTVLKAKESQELFVIDTPGEYEYKGITIHGTPTFHDNTLGKKRGKNTMYRAEMEDISVLHMGSFGEDNLRPETLEQIKEIDILLLPIGGETVIDVAGAAKIAGQIEPRIIIPMHYDMHQQAKKKKIISEFFKEMGTDPVKPVKKHTLRKKDLPKEDTEIVVLEAQS